MKKIKSTKGITLVALVITIIILLILAGITLSSLTGENGIIARAKEASIKTDIADTKEQIQLALMEKYDEDGKYTDSDIIEVVKQITGKDISKGVNTITTKKGNTVNIADLWLGDWTQDKTSVINGIVTLEVGQAVTGYTANGVGDGNWYVLGADRGKLLITTDSNQGTVELSGQEGYVNGVNLLNAKAEKYSDGNMASSVRSINVEDINRVTGYDPDVAQYNNGKDVPGQWKNEVTYRLDVSDGKIHYQGTKYPTSDISSSYGTFTYWTGKEWKGLESGESVTITGDYYMYYTQTLSATSSSETSINGSTNAYNLLFKNASDDSTSYWLGSVDVDPSQGYVYYDVRCAGGGSVDSQVLYNSNGRVVTRNLGFRPVASLGASVSVTSDGVLSK